MKTLLKVRRLVMVTFKVDNGERKKEIVNKFLEKTGDPVFTKCLWNRLEYGSKYSNEVEQKIEEVLTQIDFENAEPPWLHLLD